MTTTTSTDVEIAEQWLVGDIHALKTGPQFAAAFRLLADTFNAMTGELSSASYVSVSILPNEPADVDVIAAALGVPAITEKQSGGTYRRIAKSGGVHVFASCLPPVTETREELLAKLARLDAENACTAEAKPGE